MKVLIPYKTEQRKENEEVRQIRTFILLTLLLFICGKDRLFCFHFFFLLIIYNMCQ